MNILLSKFQQLKSMRRGCEEFTLMRRIKAKPKWKSRKIKEIDAWAELDSKYNIYVRKLSQTKMLLKGYFSRKISNTDGPKLAYFNTYICGSPRGQNHKK